jgi:hypothetical protein
MPPESNVLHIEQHSVTADRPLAKKARKWLKTRCGARSVGWKSASYLPLQLAEHLGSNNHGVDAIDLLQEIGKAGRKADLVRQGVTSE